MNPFQVLLCVAGAVVFFVGLVTQRPSVILGGTVVVLGALTWAGLD